MPDHSGHRQRLRERFLREGLDSFTDIQALELLLFYGVPRRDTNPIAHALLEHFGSLSQVLEASPEELCKVEGVGDGAAAILKLVTEFARFYEKDRAAQVKVLPTLESCAAYLQPFFYGKHNETAYLLCLDGKCKVLCCRQLGEGNVNATMISVRKVVEMAIGANASSVVLAHNHPGGLAIPSVEDLHTTKQIASALFAVEVRLIDHIIVADDDYVSLVQSGYRFLD